VLHVVKINTAAGEKEIIFLVRLRVACLFFKKYKYAFSLTALFVPIKTFAKTIDCREQGNKDLLHSKRAGVTIFSFF
jgi:hypothetical protein